MRLTSKSRHAVRAMMELAMRSRWGKVALRDLSEAQHISVSCAEQIFVHLRRAGLVTAVRGRRGGYRLTRSAREITIAEIIASVERPALSVAVGRNAPAIDEQEDDLTHDLWCQLSEKIYDFLNDITLATFVEQPRLQAVKGGGERQHARTRSDI